MLIQSMTTYPPEKKAWVLKFMNMITPPSYPPNPSPYQRSLCYKRGVEFVLEDDGETAFNLPAASGFPSASNLSTILYSRSKVWEEQMYKDLNRHYVINLEHKRYVKAFVSLMRRYRKEYRKHYLRKYIIPLARREATRGILFDETQLPKELLDEVVSYI